VENFDHAARAVLFQEAALLDAQRWQEWLELFTIDCEYWMPAWKAEHELTADPRREVSLIYYASRAGLEERVWRVQTARAPSAIPLPRTQHNVSNIVAKPADTGCIEVHSNWVVNQYNLKTKVSAQLFGRYEHELVLRDGQWKISRKKTILLNELPAVLDFYCL
jgi:3-phenylpropionate/cinnamic acid dioxygenase small subunit